MWLCECPIPTLLRLFKADFPQSRIKLADVICFLNHLDISKSAFQAWTRFMRSSHPIQMLLTGSYL